MRRFLCSESVGSFEGEFERAEGCCSLYKYSVIIDPFGGSEVVLTILANDPLGCVDRFSGGGLDGCVALEDGVFEGYGGWAGQGIEYCEVE